MLANATGYLPDFPRGLARGPEIFQLRLVPQRVHRLPKALVTVGGELAGVGQRLKRSALPHIRVLVEMLEDRRLEHEKSAVDPRTISLRLFFEGIDPMVQLDIQGTEPARGLHRRHRGRDPL